MLYFQIIIFLIGLSVGSFLNVVIFRLWNNEDIVLKRSHCPKCNMVLSWHDLIPFFSFVFLKGRCRNCGSKISWQYPLVELATGVLFVLLAVNLGIAANIPNSIGQVAAAVFYFALFAIFVVMFVFDVRHYVLPSILLYLSIILVIAITFLNWENFTNYAWGAMAASGFIAFLALATKEKAMGYGDAYLGFALGFLVGWPLALLGLFLSFLSGSVIGLALIFSGKKTMKSPIPFGPFLITSFGLVFFYASQLQQLLAYFAGF